MVDFDRVLKIGTRGSPLAMVQTRTVEARLLEAFPDLEIEVVVIKTSGDWLPEHGETRLSEAEGGKGLFAKEIEQALLDGDIDIAVHSMKDMDSNLPEGLVIDHMLPREDVRDALLFSHEIRNADGFDASLGFDALPQKTIVGTASVRRAALLKAKRPDLEIIPIRGNVGTRIEKVRSGQVGCTCLAMAGLNRLSLSDEADFMVAPDEMLPAAGQGAVGVETRADDNEILTVISQISDLNTVLCVKAERESLRVLDGSCQTPISAYAVLEDDEMWLRLAVYSLDGQAVFEDDIRGSVQNVEEAVNLGHDLAVRLKKRIPQEILKYG